MKPTEYNEKIERLIYPILADLNSVITILGPNVSHSLLRARSEIEKAIDSLFLSPKEDLEEQGVGDNDNYSEQYLANMAGLSLEDYRNGK